MRWTSFAAFLLILLFAGAADGLMDALGPVWFLAVGALVMGAALILEGRPKRTIVTMRLSSASRFLSTGLPKQ